jgi:hypothetical protein
MAIVRVIKHPQRSGSAKAERNNLLYETENRDFEVKYTVISNDFRDGPNVVMNAPGVPKVGDEYRHLNDLYTIATCVDVSVRPTNSRLVWEVLAKYDSRRIINLVTDDPLAQPPTIVWTGREYDKPLIRDNDGVLVVTSSNNRFDPAAVDEEYRTVCKVTRNEPPNTINGAFIRQYKMSLSRYPIAGWPAFHARMNSIESTQQLSNGVLHDQVTYEVEFRTPPDTFFSFILDADYRDPKGRLFRDPVTNQPFQSMTLLNGRGKPIVLQKAMLAAPVAAIDTTITVTKVPGDLAPDLRERFPPSPKPPDAFGNPPGPDWYFEVLIDNEVMEVIDTSTHPVWTVRRAQNATVAAAHSVGRIVSLEPYRRRFRPHKIENWRLLNLPIV